MTNHRINSCVIHFSLSKDSIMFASRVCGIFKTSLTAHHTENTPLL